MTVSLKHQFQSSNPDGPDSSQVQPSNWNAEHSLTMGTGKLLGRTTAGTGAAEEISAGTGLALSGGSLDIDTVPIANGGTGANTATDAINALLPTQTSNAGKFLTTDGSSASWGTFGVSNAEILVVAGGGSSGYGSISATDSGGGGAGGLVYAPSVPISAGFTYTVSVGAGGPATSYSTANGTSSYFGLSSYTGASGGGGGGYNDGTYIYSANSGGSGGGGTYNTPGGSTTQTTAYIPPAANGFGTAGANGAGSGQSRGGGGAGAASTNQNGGVGKAYSLVGTSTYYAGGGAGSTGTGGLGGGGNAGSAGTANTGGGGGSDSSGRNGGSGVTIIKTLTPASSTTGSPTVTTVGGYTVYQFNSSGTITW